jgi:hypothetical protein
MSAKSCDNCKMIMVNYADLWLVHSHVAILLDGDRLELRKLKAHSTLLGACTTVLSPPCEACVSLKGKPFHATKENIEL